MKLSIVIPTYNEETTIRDVVERVRAVRLDKLGIETEIIVVDDGSNDGTQARVQGLRGIADVLLFHDRNRGKGAAVRTALEAASGDVVLIQDADLEYDPNAYPRLLAPILEGKADVVYGSRFRSGEAGRVSSFWHYTVNLVLTTLSNMTTDLNLSDMETSYKAFRRACLIGVPLRQNRRGFDAELTARLAKGGFRFYEVGVGYHARSYAAGRKTRPWHRLSVLWSILRYGLARRSKLVTTGTPLVKRDSPVWAPSHADAPRAVAEPPEEPRKVYHDADTETVVD